jgi:ketosteroid isomerase-like protein
MTDNQRSSLLPRPLKHAWSYGFVLGLVLVLGALLIWFLLRGGPPLDTSEKRAETPPPQAQPSSSPPAVPPVAAMAPAQSAPALQQQLEQVLAGIREANQKKDLSQLLSHYSPNFPQLTQRAQSISKNWKVYNYQKMDFDIKGIRLIAPDTAAAQVTWKVEAQNISTTKSQTISKSYLIKFAKESNQWRIVSLDKTE